jgi:hypothetical protein
MPLAHFSRPSSSRSNYGGVFFSSISKRIKKIKGEKLWTHFHSRYSINHPITRAKKKKMGEKEISDQKIKIHRK